MKRRTLLRHAAGLAATATLLPPRPSTAAAPLARPGKAREIVKITRLETFLVKPRWLFLKVHTNVGVVGIGEPILEGRARTVQTAVQEIEPYLVGKDPRAIQHHWQAIYRHAFYRGDVLMTSALSGIDHALWDIKGKLLGVPTYELFGGPTRSKVRVYGRASNPEEMKKKIAASGYTAFKCTPAKKGRPARFIETKGAIDHAVERFAALRQAGGPDVDIAIDFHGAIPLGTCKVLIKALEPYQPFWIEEPIVHQNTDMIAELARSTHIPIAYGERNVTKWDFREILEKKAAHVLQPDMCHAGGLSEVRTIAGMAEAYYCGIAPHNPLGPISLAVGIQLGASIPNYVIQEFSHLGEGYLKTPFKVVNGYIDVPTGPGLGIELDEAALKDKIGHDWRNGEAFDPDDGSVMDW